MTASVPTSPETSPSPSAPSEGHLRGSLLLLAGSIVAAAVDFVVQVALVRYLSKADFGAWSYALAIVVLLATVAQLEMRQVVARFVPAYLERGRRSDARGAVVLALITSLGFGLALALVLGVTVVAMGFRPTDDLQALRLLVAVAALIPLQAVDSVFTGLFAALGASRAILVRQSVLGPALRAVVVGATIFLDADLLFLAAATVLATAIAVAIYAIAFARLVRRRLQEAEPSSPATEGRSLTIPARELLAFAATLLTSTLVWSLIESSDAVLLGWLAGPEAVASFRVVLPLARLNQLAAATFGVFFLVRAAQAHAIGDGAAMRDVYWRTALWMTLLSFPVLVFTVAFAPVATVGLYGEAYASSAPVLAVLSLAYFVNTALGFNGQTLKVHGRLRFMMAVDLGAAALNVVAILILIPPFGVLGAAVGTGATLVVHNVLKQAGLRRYTTVGALPSSMAGLYAVILSATALIALLGTVVALPLPIAIVIALGAGAVAAGAFRRRLAIERVFPEALRLPLPARLRSWLFP